MLKNGNSEGRPEGKGGALAGKEIGVFEGRKVLWECHNRNPWRCCFGGVRCWVVLCDSRVGSTSKDCFTMLFVEKTVYIRKRRGDSAIQPTKHTSFGWRLPTSPSFSGFITM